jgi:hypothetical protein
MEPNSKPSPRSLSNYIQKLLCLKHHYGSYWHCLYERFVSSIVHAAISLHKH